MRESPFLSRSGLVFAEVHFRWLWDERLRVAMFAIFDEGLHALGAPRLGVVHRAARFVEKTAKLLFGWTAKCGK
jgi:hypothetical protein